jgi:hypothetical protein
MRDTNVVYKSFKTKWFGELFKKLDMKPYKGDCMIRLTEGGMLQGVQFQIDAYGEPKFCINVFTRYLYWRNAGLGLTPGFRIAKDIYDTWFSFENEENAEANFSTACDFFLKKGLPFINETTDAAHMLLLYKGQKNDYIDWPYSPWLEYYLGLLYLDIDQGKAMEYLNAALINLRNDNNPRIKHYSYTCEKVIKAYEKQDELRELLNELKQESIKNLRLDKYLK